MVALTYLAARMPEASAAERAALAERFTFTPIEIPSAEARGTNAGHLRAVHPSLAGIAGWISSVGAAAALHDLDGDGVANDLCLVDPRTDTVTVQPVPGTGPRYASLLMAPGDGAYRAGTYAPMGCIPADMNEDGRADVLVIYWGRPPVAFLQVAPGRGAEVPAGGDALAGAMAERRLAFVPREIVADPAIWNSNTATFADIDGDGHLDIVVGNYFADGDAVLDPSGTGRVAMQDSMSRAYNGGTNRILLWRSATGGETPTVGYEEALGALEPEAAQGWTLAIGAADLDGDLLPELYFANDFGPDRLFHNRSTPGHVILEEVRARRTLTAPRSRVLGGDSFKGMGVDFGDVDGDGLFDIAVSNIAADYSLHESHFLFLGNGRTADFERGVAPYADASEALGVARDGWGWDARLADFDNDGVLELVRATGFVAGTHNRWPELQELATANDGLLSDVGAWPRFHPGDDLSGHQPNAFYTQDADGRYVDIAAELGVDSRAVARGIATADVDGDGDLDMVVAVQWGPSVLWRNDAPSPGQSLILDLRHGELPAIGAQARALRPDGRLLVAQVDGGSGHSGVRSPELHMGLGNFSANGPPIAVELSWRGPRGVLSAMVTLAPGRHRVDLKSLVTSEVRKP